MTTAQYVQEIDKAYQQYVALFNSGAPLAEQQASFERYMSLREGDEENVNFTPDATLEAR